MTVAQLSRLSNILDNAGQVVLGVMVINPLVAGIDKTDLKVLILGSVATVCSWMLSLALAQKEKNERNSK